MTRKKKNLALLPSGFVDLLPPYAEQEYVAIRGMMCVFSAFGYNRVKPPLLEFEESLFAPGPGASLVDDTFRVMDPVSHKMMGLRSDITPQIARIACSRLGDEARPLRLCYANDALRTKAGQQRVERQFCQVGCEIIGEESVEADIEACVVALIALKELGIKNLTIDLSFPHIIEQLLDKTDEEKRETIKKALERRSPDGLKGVDKNIVSTLSKLAKAAGKAGNALKVLGTMPQFKADVAKLEKIYKGIARALDELKFSDVQITIDPVETRGFKYYSGLGFTLFAASVSGELGRGGRYNIHFGGEEPVESATGFTLYMDTVRKAMPSSSPKKIIAAGNGESWAKIREQQRKGVVVVRAGKKDKFKKGKK